MNLTKNKIKKLYYISPRDMRKNRADAVHIMYSCAAFSNNGIDVELITPKIIRNDYTVDNDDIFSLYDVPNNFKITELNTRIKEVNNKSSVLVVGINKLILKSILLLMFSCDLKKNIEKHKRITKYLLFIKMILSNIKFID